MKANDTIMSLIVAMALGAGFLIGGISTVEYIKMMCTESGRFRIGSDVQYSCEVVK